MVAGWSDGRMGLGLPGEMRIRIEIKSIRMNQQLGWVGMWLWLR